MFENTIRDGGSTALLTLLTLLTWFTLLTLFILFKVLKQQHICFKYWLERLERSWNGLVQNEKKVGLGDGWSG